MYESKSKRKSDKRKQNQQSPMADYENDKKKVGRWTPEEDEKLQKLIEGFVFKFMSRIWRKELENHKWHDGRSKCYIVFAQMDENT